jgi:uncharacterized integral membrane protein
MPMIRLIRTILALVGLIVIVAFAIANRTPVDVSLAPLPIALELPVYGVFLIGLVVGGLLGGIAAWLGGHRYRRDARRTRRTVRALEHQVADLKKQQPGAPAEGYALGRTMATGGASS